MRCVIIRDDDTNAFTPVSCLETLYRPFLSRGMPVNLAVIPSVRGNVTLPDDSPEGYLVHKHEDASGPVPISGNPALVNYLHRNTGYHILQHGCHHDPREFDLDDRIKIRSLVAHGRRCLLDAGFEPPTTFVAPHDKLSAVSYEELAGRFSVISTGWFELRRLPVSWWPRYLWKRLTRKPHWRMDRTLLLSHPGCLLSCHRPCDGMLDSIVRQIESRSVTVLVTHWWEYFQNRVPNTQLIEVLHQTAACLAARKDVKVISFTELARGSAGPLTRLPLLKQ